MLITENNFSLPTETLYKIFNYLDGTNLALTSHICRLWRDISEDIISKKKTELSNQLLKKKLARILAERTSTKISTGKSLIAAVKSLPALDKITLKPSCRGEEWLGMNDGILEEALRSVKNLRSFSLKVFCEPNIYSQITFGTLYTLAREHPKLKKLVLQSCPTIDEKGLITALSRLQYLEVFEIKSGELITHNVLEAIGKLVHLRKLTIKDQDLPIDWNRNSEPFCRYTTDKEGLITVLSQLQGLEEVWIDSDNLILPELLEAIKRLVHLKKLTLSGLATSLTQDHLEALKEACPKVDINIELLALTKREEFKPLTPVEEAYYRQLFGETTQEATDEE